VLVIICSFATPAFAQRKQRQQRTKPRVTPVATSITFDVPEPALTPKKRIKVKATVLDQNGKTMPDAKVTWEDVPQADDSQLSFSRSLDDSEGNTLIITGGAGNPAIHEKITTRIRAVSDDANRDLFVTYESTPKPTAAKITFQPDKVDLKADGEATIKASLTDSDDKAVHSNVKWALANPEMSEFVRLGTVVNDDTTNSITVLGRTSKNKAPDAVTLVAAAGSAVGVVTINYKAPAATGAVKTMWNILPPKIAGDNFGRTIKNDYYCIEVVIQNNSGKDLALAGLYFNQPGAKEELGLPSTSYNTAHGSILKRKLTHPRAMTLAIVDGLGTLMTGFNPFFHDINHAKNYSQFIDILSNPLKSGIEKGWKDPYPDELANFERDVVKDDKVIPNNSTFKTKIFVPKRLLFTNEQKTQRENLDIVRAKLGELHVLGYQFHMGEATDFSATP
jgi:hypothetical protein